MSLDWRDPLLQSALDEAGLTVDYRAWFGCDHDIECRRAEVFDAAIDYSCKVTAAVCGIPMFGDDPWAAASAALVRCRNAFHALHPLVLAADWGTDTEADYYREARM